MRRPFKDNRPIGPFTELLNFKQSEETPPQPPRGWSPASEITDSMGSFTWWTKWEGLEPSDAGASTFYDVENDRIFIEPRKKVFHDEMVLNIVGKSPIPRFPESVSPAAAQLISDNPTFVGQEGDEWVAEIPTDAQSAQNQIRQLKEDRKIFNTPEQTKVSWIYKHVAALRMVDFPPEATARIGYQTRRGSKTQEFKMEDLYRELRFIGELPDKKVELNL